MISKIIAIVLICLRSCLCQWIPFPGPWLLSPGSLASGTYFLDVDAETKSIKCSPISNFNPSRSIYLYQSGNTTHVTILIGDPSLPTGILLTITNGSFTLVNATDGSEDWSLIKLSDHTAQFQFVRTGRYLDFDILSEDENGAYDLQVDDKNDTRSGGQVWTLIPYSSVYTSTILYTATVTSTYTYSLPPSSIFTSSVYACAKKRLKPRETSIDGTVYNSVATVTDTASIVSETFTYTQSASSDPTSYVVVNNCEPRPAPTSSYIPDPSSSPVSTAGSATTALSTNNNHGHSTRAGIITGSVIGAILVIGIVAFMIWFLKRRKRRQRREGETREISAAYYGPLQDHSNHYSE